MGTIGEIGMQTLMILQFMMIGKSVGVNRLKTETCRGGKTAEFSEKRRSEDSLLPSRLQNRIYYFDRMMNERVFMFSPPFSLHLETESGKSSSLASRLGQNGRCLH